MATDVPSLAESNTGVGGSRNIRNRNNTKTTDFTDLLISPQMVMTIFGDASVQNQVQVQSYHQELVEYLLVMASSPGDYNQIHFLTISSKGNTSDFVT